MKNIPLPSRILHILTVGCMLVLTAAATMAAAPEIAVEQASADIPENGSKSFGSENVGSAGSPLTFTIKNTGDAALTDIAVTKTGPEQEDFSFTHPPASVAANSSATFTVTFAPSARGNRSAIIRIASNDADENPFRINLSGTGAAPEIAVEQNAVNISSRDTKSFGSVNVNAENPLIFTIRNTGDAPLSDLGSSISGTDSGDFTVVGFSSNAIAAGGSADFTIKFKPSTFGSKTAKLSITHNDPDGNESPFEINLTGTGLAPRIAVEQPTAHSISNGAEVDFGNTTNGFSKDLIFTIRNPGNAPLNLTSFLFEDVDVRTFIVMDPLPTTVAANGSTTFTARFSPNSAGNFASKLTIENNAANFVIHLKGSGVVPLQYSDDFGYVCTEQAGGNPTPFLNAADAGVVIDSNLTGIDKYSEVDMGFSFTFYDKIYSRCSISTTGLITFGGTSVNFRPVGIPNTAAPDNFIAPLWTDMKIDGSSKIMYKTSGQAPDRAFIVKFENALLYKNGSPTGKRVTFQVQLQETANSILVRYDSADASAYPDQQVTVGIESRNYGIADANRPGAGVVGNQGLVGVQFRNGSLLNPVARPEFPSTIVFSRPVIATVESKYYKPVPTPGNPNATVETSVGSQTLGVKPFGVIYGTPYNSVKRFEAPEYIYLDKDFNELPGPGDFATDPEADLAYYRLVNDGYAIDGQVIQGTHTFFTTTLTHDVTVIWRWKLEYAAIVRAVDIDGNPLNVGEGIGAPSPGFGRHWVSKNAEFSASIARTVGDGTLGADLSGFRYNAKNYSVKIGQAAEGAAMPLATTGDRVATTPVTINDWVRITWTMASQIRYRFDAGSGNPADGTAAFLGQSFVRIYDSAGTPATRFSFSANSTVWIDSGYKVEIGAFYRTADRCFTLGNFPASPGGDLSTLGTDISVLDDVMVDDGATPVRNRVARTFTIPHASSPTEVHFIYSPTVFRAEIPLGQAFDAANPNVQLVPDLCEGAVLRVADLGPSENFTRVGEPASGTPTGTPARWDRLGKRLLPVQPGTYQLEWPDSLKAGTNYKIEIVTGYPGDSASLATAKEQKLPNGNSRRATGPGGYIFETQLARVDSDFPGSVPAPQPDAHYRHLYDPNPARQAPTKLDISATDEWAFNQLTYTDLGTAASVDSTPTKGFKVSGSGRSVLLYSHRPNPDEAADGTLTKEHLAVRVVRSSPLPPVKRTDSRLVLGQHGLILGNGSSAAEGAFGVIQSGANPGTANIISGDRFVMDFWLNAKGLKESAPVTLTGCATVAGSIRLKCASTAALVPDMALAGTNIAAGTRIKSITDSTTLVLSNAATGSNTGLTLTASNKPITVVSTGGGSLNVTLDPKYSTVTANYHGIPVTHILPKAGAGWRHYVVHVFTYTLFGTGVTVVDFYQDGIREERSFVTSWFPGTADSSVGTVVTEGSLRFGANADPLAGLMIDQFRMFNLGSVANRYLTGSELTLLRTQQNMMASGKPLRSATPQLWFSFEGTPTTSGFANLGTLPDVVLGPLGGSGTFPETRANVDLQEVALRIASTLDNAGFKGSGYILNAVSNYNAELYDRSAEVGAWGPVFPVNHNKLFTGTKALEIAYYENPYRTDRLSNPNVAWPYVATEFKDVVFPTQGPDKDKRIYIASRIGSEGVDKNGRPQGVYDLSRFAGLKIYNQPAIAGPGYNPNEEHALVAASGRAALRVKNLGDGIPNNPPLAAFALQKDANLTSSPYTSEPWVLVQVNNLITGEPEMAAYAVEKTRTGGIPFPRPTDAKVSATPGLAYESADKPEDRFLTLDPAKSFDFAYTFDYPVFAGDLVIPPYPLNIVIGNVAMQDERGGNIQVNNINRRTLWRDVNKHAWAVSGDGSFFNQFFYPMRGDFYLSGNPAAGTPVAWLPEGTGFTGTGTSLEPVKVVYNSRWRSDYPKLKRGETLTYQGGEYFNENPGSNGLPALVAMKAAEIVYDSSTPDMVISASSSAEIGKASARIIRPLDRREVPGFTNANMSTSGFTPAATDKLLIIAERWYFKELPGSLGKKFYYDSLASKLVFRGYLNGKDSGASDLTAGPDPLNILEPNVMTIEEYASLRALSDQSVWTNAIDGLFKLCQNPNGLASPSANVTSPVFLQGVKPLADGSFMAELTNFWTKALNLNVKLLPVMNRLDSFGVGAALVPNSSLLTKTPDGSLYVTIAENNRTELDGAPVSLHIIEIIPDRYRGAIKVVESSDAFSEKVMLLHNADFGSNTGDVYYEWWIRDAAPLDLVANEILPNGNLTETDSTGHTLWQQYLPKTRIENGSLTDTQKHLGLNSIVFEGRPDVTLADKLVLMRYRHKSESGWNLVPFEFNNASQSWSPGAPAPFQWAGAANSPQLQADGGKRYIPQLVMGWVKRVLDRINPYEARYTDFFSNEHPATYSSQIQIAGGPFAGKVALNSDKNVIENTGLIELYETVLQRAKELSIDNSSNPVSTDGINQALLLAATRLSTLYELLGSEAYSDAQDSTITVTDDSGLANVASFTHAFQNFEPDLLHEELSLLRGTDFRKSYPVYNRLFWNYAKGLGEAAYNVNYNIHDVTRDGFINEDDARKLHPQGHGDAWGHYVNALGKSYDLLRAPNFSWKTRSELYSLMQNVLEVDFLDEKTFARLAAEKARAGRDIVRGTYRLKYTQDPDGEWQGYTDGADPARAWGVSEWAHRAGQGAYFDWAVANSLLPEDASGATPVPNPEGLDRIERLGAIDEIGGIAGSFHEIQAAMDEADGGVNPLGFDSDAIAFDIDPFYDGDSWERRTHFEQIYDRAVVAGNNALATLNFAAQADNKLRKIADDTNEITAEAFRQDLDYRNRLIEIFGRPYDGTIGFGKAYPEGYEGPDNFLFAYLDRTTIDQIIPSGNNTPDNTKTIDFDDIKRTVTGLATDATLLNLYGELPNGGAMLTTAVQTFILGNNYEDPTTSFSMPVARASDYAFQAPVEWGRRTSYGKLQNILEDMLREEAGLKGEIDNYIGFLGDFETLTLQLRDRIEVINKTEQIGDAITGVRAGFNSATVAVETAIGIAQIVSNVVGDVASAVEKAIPTAIGFSTDALAPARGAAYAAGLAAREPINIANDVKTIAVRIADLVKDEVIARLERNATRADYTTEINGMLAEIEKHTGNDGPLRAGIGVRLQNLEILRQQFYTTQAEGFRLLREREAFNKNLAAKVQSNRYQDMVMRLSRNEAMGKYQTAFGNAARYTWLAAKAYDYETSLDPGHPAAAGPVFDRIVKERQLGLWTDGEPQAGQNGLAEILNHLAGNFAVLKGQLGLNNSQPEQEKISLRSEFFRIGPSVASGGEPASDDRWKDALKARIVPDLNQMPEFVRYCRPFANPSSGAQPGLVIRFSTSIEPGLNVFGLPLLPGDHNYSVANFATKVRGFGVWMENYNAAGLAITPRAYLVPIGTDFLRTSNSAQPFTRAWSVNDQRIPTPFLLNPGNITSPGFIPTLNGVDGAYGEPRRYGDFRVYHDSGDPNADDSELVLDSRLIGRSVWNSGWMLVIPGASLDSDPLAGLTKLTDTVGDIKLYFKTYSHQGQ